MKVFDGSGNKIMEANYLIYSQDECIFCDRAKALLRKHGLKYLEIKIHSKNKTSVLADLEHKLGERPNTVPVIFDANGLYIGGYTELELILGDG